MDDHKLHFSYQKTKINWLSEDTEITSLDLKPIVNDLKGLLEKKMLETFSAHCSYLWHLIELQLIGLVLMNPLVKRLHFCVYPQH